MSAPFLQDDRLIDLLVKQTTEGLTTREQSELKHLLTRYPDADADVLARAAAAIALAGDLDDEPLPAALRERIEADAATTFAGSDARVTDIRTRREAAPARAPSPSFPWLAAAACLVLAVIAWWPRIRESMNPQAPPPVAAVPTAAQERQALLAQQGVVSSSWSATDDPASKTVSGDVVWDQKTQKGYLRFSGLAANDPQKFQYQLWIFDKNQDDRYPIDGGVFDIPAGQAEVLVPIDPKIAVAGPVMFAVTMEKPGGVVVSGREHIVALAKVAAG